MAKTWKMPPEAEKMVQEIGLKEVGPLKHGLVNGFRHVVAHLMEADQENKNSTLKGKYYIRTSNQPMIPEKAGFSWLKLKCHKAGCKWELKNMAILADSAWEVPIYDVSETGKAIRAGTIRFTHIDQETLDKLIYSLENVW